MLSRLAQEFADEIANHDWSDAPWRIDRAGHDRATDSKHSTRALTIEETERVRTNVAFVTAQVLRYSDPNLDLHEFAVACGVPRQWTTRHNGEPTDGTMRSGLRWVDEPSGLLAPPGEK